MYGMESRLNACTELDETNLLKEVIESEFPSMIQNSPP
jgi:hypothetical protein